MKYRAIKRMFSVAAIAGALGAMAGGTALAADFGGMKDPMPAVAPSKWELSANVAITSDYVFRGFSQTDENFAIQGGFDVSYKWFYAGVWASSLDFGGAVTPAGEFVDVADIEIDLYAGVKKTVGPFELDFGFIYYAYPNAFDPGAELDYVEIKLGWSKTIFKDLAYSTTIFYSPEYTGEIGPNWVFETKLEKPLTPKLSISGTYGRQEGDEGDGGFDYSYWNIGLTKTFKEKFSFDIRYWDTADLTGCSAAVVFQCDARVVGTLAASF